MASRRRQRHTPGPAGSTRAEEAEAGSALAVTSPLLRDKAMGPHETVRIDAETPLRCRAGRVDAVEGGVGARDVNRGEIAVGQ